MKHNLFIGRPCIFFSTSAINVWNISTYAYIYTYTYTYTQMRVCETCRENPISLHCWANEAPGPTTNTESSSWHLLLLPRPQLLQCLDPEQLPISTTTILRSAAADRTHVSWPQAHSICQYLLLWLCLLWFPASSNDESGVPVGVCCHQTQHSSQCESFSKCIVCTCTDNATVLAQI